MADKKILIVEDNAIIAMETIERLKRLGYAVSGVAATGRDAIRLAGMSRPDLILMDINLRGDMDGIEAARQIQRKDPIPLIYLTAYSDEETLKRAMDSKPFKYLVKPYRERDLYSSIEDALKAALHPPVTAAPREMQAFTECVSRSDDGIIAIGPDGKIQYLNRKAEQITGWSRNAVTGKPLTDIMIFGTPERRGGGDTCSTVPAITGLHSCVITSPEGDMIPACAAWISRIKSTTLIPPALAVFWVREGAR